MSIAERIEKTSKLLGLLVEFVKLTGLSILVVVGVAAVAFPAWAQERLRALNLHIKEVDIFGIKIAQDETFAMGDALASAQLGLDSVTAQLAAADGLSGQDRKAAEGAIESARKSVSEIQESLNRQETAIKETKAKWGIVDPKLPSTGWLFVGRVGESGTYYPAPRVAPKRTAIANGKVAQLAIMYDAPVVSNGTDCVRTQLKDAEPPSPDSVQILLKGDAAVDLKVIGTTNCPAADGGKWVYAQIEIPRDRVRFARYSEWK